MVLETITNTPHTSSCLWRRLRSAKDCSSLTYIEGFFCCIGPRSSTEHQSF